MKIKCIKSLVWKEIKKDWLWESQGLLKNYLIEMHRDVYWVFHPGEKEIATRSTFKAAQAAANEHHAKQIMPFLEGEE